MNDDARTSEAALATSAATGVPGLDDVLRGGLTPNRVYLLEGVPGSGKTTLAMQFALEGIRNGESALYVTLSETEDEIRAVALSHGWDLAGLVIRELFASEQGLQFDEQYTMFHPAEIELSETTKTLLADVAKVNPSRVVFDSLSELRLLAGNPLRYRRQILAMKQYFGGRRCTVLLLDDMSSSDQDTHAQTIAHGVVRLEQLNPV
jgi:circadian clock protein KaiC